MKMVVNWGSLRGRAAEEQRYALRGGRDGYEN